MSPLEHRVAVANYTARRVREEMRLRRLRAPLGLAGEEQPPAGWGEIYGARNGGPPVRPFRREVLPLDLRDKLAHGIYPAALTSKSERTWKELRS